MDVLGLVPNSMFCLDRTCDQAIRPGLTTPGSWGGGLHFANSF